MASRALGGVLQGLMQGYDYQNELNRRAKLDEEQRADRENERRRQGRADQRAEVSFAHALEDREHAIERRPVLESREDETYGLMSQIRKQNLRQGKMELERMPTRYAQQDAEFASRQAGRRQRMSLARMQQELARMGLDEKRLEQGYRQTEQALGRGIAQARATGDWSGFVKGFNATLGKESGAPLDTIQTNPDGSLTMRMADGTARQFADSRQLEMTAAALTRPDVYLKSLFNSLTGGGDSKEPAAIQETNAIFERLPPLQGEDEDSRWMRAYALRSAKAGATPEDTAAGFYKSIMSTGYQKPEAAMEMTAEFMKTFFPDSHGAWNPAPAGRGQGGAPSFAQPQAAPQAASQGHGRIVRTGTLNGRRVAQYEDGTIAPIQ